MDIKTTKTVDLTSVGYSMHEQKLQLIEELRIIENNIAIIRQEISLRAREQEAEKDTNPKDIKKVEQKKESK